MSNIPSISGKRVVKAFERLGFFVERVNGSHHVMKMEGNRYKLSVPVHGNSDIKRGTLKGLIAASGCTLEEFIEAAE